MVGISKLMGSTNSMTLCKFPNTKDRELIKESPISTMCLTKITRIPINE